jgi:hypothetical protein
MPGTRAWFACVLAALLAPACAERPAPDAAAGASGGAPSARAATPAASGSKAVAALPFIENDAPRALAEAKQRGVPLFVEAWAPW